MEGVNAAYDVGLGFNFGSDRLSQMGSEHYGPGLGICFIPMQTSNMQSYASSPGLGVLQTFPSTLYLEDFCSISHWWHSFFISAFILCVKSIKL